LHQTFEQWKICEVIAVGLNIESRGYVECLCLGDLLELLSRAQDEVWNFFEKLIATLMNLNKLTRILAT